MTTFIAFVCGQAGVYEEGKLSPKNVSDAFKHNLINICNHYILTHEYMFLFYFKLYMVQGNNDDNNDTLWNNNNIQLIMSFFLLFFSQAFVYLFVVNNLSQFVAMYCLVLFYKAMRRELDPMSPLAKFLCIKAVVFFSFL